MNYRKLINAALNNNRDSGMTAVAVIAGLAAGAAIGVLLAPKSGRETRRSLGISSVLATLFETGSERVEKQHKNLSPGYAVEDLRGKTWEHADHLQGPEKKRKNASLIKVPSAGTDAWKTRTVKEQPAKW